jgi:hypothetical protein
MTILLVIIALALLPYAIVPAVYLVAVVIAVPITLCSLIFSGLKYLLAQIGFH